MRDKTPPTLAMPEVAYQNRRFIESGDARSLRIISEYMEPLSRLRRAGVQHTVVFFGSARILSRQEAQQKLREVETRVKEGSVTPASAEVQQARMAVQMSRYYEDARELSNRLTRWSLSFGNGSRFLVVCSGGGPGIMEAANRGAAEAGGKSIGLNIKLPMEQKPNPFITPELSFMFRYFFMRKLWFSQPAKALIVFPGGFGTMDELWEFLTLIQTRKMGHRVSILLYGSKFWKRAIDFGWLVESGTIEQADLQILRFADSPKAAFEILKHDLTRLIGVRPARRHRFF